MSRRTRAAVATTALAAVAFTLLVTVSPALSFAYRSVEAHMVIETAAALTTGLAALLIAGRVRRFGRHSDLALFVALLLFCGANLVFSVLPPILGIERGGGFSTWAPVAGRLASAAMFAYAAFASDDELRDPGEAVRRALLGVAGLLALIVVVVAPLSGALPPAIDPGLSPEAGARPRLVGEPGVLAVQALAMVLFAAAAAGFVRRVDRTGEELSAWLAVAATLGAGSRLNYLLFPSLYSEWVYTGDFLRLGFFVVLCVGAAREIVRAQRLEAEARVLDDRRRMARDIHDGLAQELAFIVTHTRRLETGARTDGDGSVLVRQLRDAAQRALDESRAAIDVLTLSRDETVADAVCRAAEHVAERHGARVRADVSADLALRDPVRDTLVRIVREAVTNAVRHGGATTVTLALSAQPLVLRVTDDGCGFDPGAVADGGFGMTSMRERAESIGGRLTVSSAPGEGTVVELRVP